MNGRLILPFAVLVLSGCTPGTPGTGDPVIAAREWHAQKRGVDADVAGALEGEGGADYPKAIAILRASGRPPGVIALEVGQLVTAAYRDNAVARMPAETLDDGIALLERAATGHGEGAAVAPQWLRLLFERGLARSGTPVLAPVPRLAACWAGVEKRPDRDAAARCVAARRTGNG